MRATRSAFALLLLAACSSPPEPQPPPPPEAPSSWVKVDGQGDAFSTRCVSIRLSGGAFISSELSQGYQRDAAEAGVLVRWENLTTGSSGPTVQRVERCTSPLPSITNPLCDHTWSADVPLAPGENRLRIVATNAAGTSGEAEVTTSRLPGFAISGGIVSWEGVPLAGVSLQAHGPVQATARTDADGRFELTCLAEGSYTVTPWSPCNAFAPASRQVDVPADAAAGEFRTDAPLRLEIWGQARMWIGGIADVRVRAQGAGVPHDSDERLTDAFGFYSMCVSPGVWVVTATAPFPLVPASVQLTLTNTGVRQDFYAP